MRPPAAVALIVQLDYPFRGTLSVGPDAYEKVLANMQRLHPEIIGGQEANTQHRAASLPMRDLGDYHPKSDSSAGANFLEVAPVTRPHLRGIVCIFCYEAGHTGRGLYRQIPALGQRCHIAAIGLAFALAS